jgi:hypothetical protein
MKKSYFGELTMELMMSPIFGLIMVVMNGLTEAVSFSLPINAAEKKTVFNCAGYLQAGGGCYGANNLTYRIRSPSHPP